MAFAIHSRPNLFTPPLRAAALKLRLCLGAARRAHDRRCHVASLPEDLLQDTALCPDQAAGTCAWQQDLPFFMQSGFGERQAEPVTRAALTTRQSATTSKACRPPRG